MLKRTCLLLMVCCLLLLCITTATAQEQSLTEIRITYDAGKTIASDVAVDAQVTLVQAGQETVCDAGLLLSDAAADAAEAALPQKSLRLEGDGVQLLLFNDGGDALRTKLIGVLCCELIRQSPIATPVCAQEPVVVSLNGEYQGLYTKHEAIADAIARFENLSDTAQLAIADASQKAVCGDVSGLAELFRWVETADFTLEENLQTLNGFLDTDSFLNWMAVNTYFGNGNLYAELYFYRNGSEPWKCATGNFTYSLQTAADHSAGRLVIEEGTQNHWGKAAELADKLLRVPVYRDAFLYRMGALYQALPAEVMQAALDAADARIAAALPAHMDKWAEAFAGAMAADYGYPAANSAEAQLYRNYCLARLREKTLVLRPYYVYDSVQRALEVSDAEMEKWFGCAKPELPQTPDMNWETYKTSQN